MNHTTTLAEQCAAKVAYGAALLDEHMPGWEQKINTECLDLGDYGHCVIGQLYGTYTMGLHELGIDGDPDEILSRGFDIVCEHDANRTCSYDVLTDAWVSYITEHRLPEVCS